MPRNHRLKAVSLTHHINFSWQSKWLYITMCIDNAEMISQGEVCCPKEEMQIREARVQREGEVVGVKRNQCGRGEGQG